MIKNIIGIVVVAIVVISAIIYGFTSSGSPANARAEKFDTQRIADLSGIYNSVNAAYTASGVLPQTIEQAYKDSGYGTMTYTDPETKTPYEYIPGDKRSYRLCATFSAKSPDITNNRNTYYPYGEFSKHPKGYHCFSLTTPVRLEGKIIPITSAPYEPVPAAATSSPSL